MKIIWLFLLIPFCILQGCRQRDNPNGEGNYSIDYISKTNGQYNCSYVFDNNNVLIKRFCQKDGILYGNVFYYYENGMIKSSEPYTSDTLNGTKIDYYESGVIKQITQYEKGKSQGVIKIYYPNGYIMAINLIDNDSIYFVRAYPDTNQIELFSENIIPIVFNEKNSLQMGDTMVMQVRVPLEPKFGLVAGMYILHYDRNTADLINGKNPFARYSAKITGEDLLIGLPPLSSHDKFFCYVTDSLGKAVGPTIYRDMYFK